MGESRKATAAASLTAIFLFLVASNSAPRRVGDGGEYFVMTERLASFENPALTRAELDRARVSLGSLGSGFEDALLDYPLLVGADGRQSFLHFWLYPLVATPGMWLARALQIHPNWAFTITNIALLAAAAFVLARVAPWLAVLYAIAGPIVWWVDKAHTEVFLYAALVVAVALIRRSPVWAMLAFAAAGAQNAALAAAYPVFVAVTLFVTRDARSWPPRVAGAAGGAIVVALPLFYNWLRLQRIAPMSEYAHVSVPPLFAMLGFLVEPNIGIAPAMPAIVVATGAVVLVAALRRPLPPALWWPIAIQLVLLAVWTLNPNANHGGTPGVNRWTLSLAPLTLPWVTAAYTASPGVLGRVFAGVIALTASYSVYFHMPQRPENYLQPTMLAEAFWSRGWLRATSAEVFAERTAASETPLVPTSDGACRVVLVWDMQWPLECVPPDTRLPPSCGGIDSFCLVSQHDGGVDVAPASFNGFFFRIAPQSWPASGPLASGLRTVMVSIAPDERRWRAASERHWLRERNAVDGVVLLQGDKGVLVYISRTGASPSLRIEGASQAEAYSLLPFRQLGRQLSLNRENTLNVTLPPNASNLAVAIPLPSNP
jgi:hypothetical protein